MPPVLGYRLARDTFDELIEFCAAFMRLAYGFLPFGALT